MKNANPKQKRNIALPTQRKKVQFY